MSMPIPIETAILKNSNKNPKEKKKEKEKKKKTSFPWKQNWIFSTLQFWISHEDDLKNSDH